jgi:ribbon-helix-helix CopG family protein
VATQINIRLDDATVAALDGAAAREGVTRAEMVRMAVLRLLQAVERAAAASAYQDAYGEHPETAADVRRAGRAAGRLTSEESWERWW